MSGALRKVLVATIVAVASLLFHGAALAAGDGASLSGRVTVGGDGSPLPGVVVTATDDERGVASTALADATGAFRIPFLRPGSYTVSASLAGFSSYRRTGLVLPVGQEAVLAVELRPAVASTTEVVAGAALVDPTSGQPSGAVTPAQVAALPLSTRNYLELGLLVPGTTAGRDPVFTGVVSGGAQEARWTHVSLDGATNDNFVVGGQQANVSQDSVQELQVLANSFSSEHGRSSSVVVNVVTRSGTNELHGSAYLYFRDANLEARPSFEGVATEPSRRSNEGLTLGGPVVRNRAFFFASLDRLDATSPATVAIAARPDQSGTFPAETHRTLVFAKADVAASERRHLSLSYRYDDRSQTNLGVGGGAAASYGYAQATRSQGVVLTDQWTPSSASFNELRASSLLWDQTSTPNSTLPSQQHPSYSLGGNPRFPQGGREARVGISDVYSRQLGAHYLKLGAAVARWRSDATFVLFVPGQYVYRSDDPSAPPYVFVGGSGDPTAVNYVTFYEGFVQDEWRAGSGLTLTLGLRYDFDRGAANSDHVSPFGLPAAREDADDLAPRVGFAWDVSGKGTVVVRGGGGLFYSQLFGNLAINEDINDGDRFRVAVFPCFAAPAACGDPTRPPPAPTIPQPPGLRLNSPDLVTPYTIAYNLGVAADLGGGLAVSADGVVSLGRHELAEYRENLRTVPGDTTSPRPDPRIGSIRSVHGAASSRYAALTTSVRKAVASRWWAQLAYTFSRAVNESEFFAVAVSDSRSAQPMALDRGPARTDQRHRLVLSAGASGLPLGLALGTILTAASGQPWSAYAGVDLNNDDAPPFGQDRPPGFGRNSQTSRSYVRWDLRLAKSFALGPATLELIAECFNVTDTPNHDPNTYDTVIPPDVAGTATTPPSYSAAYPVPSTFGAARPSPRDAYQPRQLQLAVRLAY